MPKQDWVLPLKIEHEFAKLLVKQKKKGFLVDEKLMKKHIVQLDRYISRIDKFATPDLPMKVVPLIKKKDGEYPYVKKVFLKGGGLSEASEKWIELAYEGTNPGFAGVFTRISFEIIDINSVAQVKNFLLDQGWVPDEWNVSKKTGKRTSPKLSATDSFLGVEGKVGKLVAMRQKFKHRRSQLEGFLKLIRHDGRITADVSGICPTARLKHKGIVNVPGGDALFGLSMREVFVVPRGYNLVGCDAASCQLRMLCHYMGDAEYTKAVVFGKKENGTDIHSVNMRIAGCASRADAKTLIYAILFGAGNNKLAAQLGCTPRQAAAMRKRFMDNLPKLKALVEALKKVWKKQGYLVGLDGRKIFVRSEHMLLVYLLQGAEAVMMKVATLFAHKYVAQYDASMVAHVHDEFQWEVLNEDSVIVGELLEKAIVQAGVFLKLNVPMAGEAEIGFNWRDTH